MPKIFIIAEKSERVSELCSGLMQAGFACSVISSDSEVEQVMEDPGLVLLDSSHSGIRELCQRIKQAGNLPIVALVHPEMPGNTNGYLDLVDDFVFEPCNLGELELRVRRLLRRRSDAGSSDVIRCGDLVIDVANYEVSVGGGPVMLTFKEYELLKSLASNPGRVFTREALLNKIWGYDYYGGDRTVDVHITRLRSKIEDANHSFIETVRNIGYRLRADL